MRPKKTRMVACRPGERCFRPRCKSGRKIEVVSVTIDEFETLRLADLNGMRQEDAARLMGVSRPTFSRIVEAARRKVADGLVNLKAIRIAGGCCEVVVRKG